MFPTWDSYCFTFFILVTIAVLCIVYEEPLIALEDRVYERIESRKRARKEGTK